MRRQDGVVIIAVLWICALIMWFALQIGSETRLQAEEEMHAMRKSQALHLAIGGSFEALAHMGKAPTAGLDQRGTRARVKAKIKKGQVEDTGDDWLPDGSPHLLKYQTGEAMVIIEDESKKVNVNQASPQQLKLVFMEAGIEDDSVAEGLSDVVADFIDKDDLPRLRGAEKDKYKQLGLQYGPFNGPMLSLDQMLLVPGISQKLFYGYGQTNRAEEQLEEDEMPRDPIFPAKYSLFQMLSVYGKNTKLRSRLEEEILEEFISWQPGGIYRILAAGRPHGGSPVVLLWLTVRNAPETERGYEVLYRKIL